MANKWIKYTLIKRPFVDDKEEVVDIEGRYNKPKVDEFKGGGCDYPDETGKLDRFEGSNSEGDRILMLLFEEAEVIHNELFQSVEVVDPLTELREIGLNPKAAINEDLTIEYPEIN